MSEKKLSVEVTIPVYNEEKELPESVSKLCRFLSQELKNYQWRITIADNASTDRTLEIARELAKKYLQVSYLHLDQKGRGRAIKKAWRKSDADICSYMDVDLSTDLKSFPPLIKALSHGFDIAIGSRLLLGSTVLGRTLKREIISRAYNILIKLIFGTRFSDAQCGFKAVTKKVVKEILPYIKNNGWFLDSELLIVGEKNGYRIYEEPVKWVDNPGSTVRVLKTTTEDLKGLWRLFWTRPWKKIKKGRKDTIL